MPSLARRARVAAGIAVAALLLAACGTQSATSTPTATPDRATAGPTSVPQDQVLFSQEVTPTLKASIDAISALTRELGSSHDYEQIAFDCADAGSTFSADRTAFENVSPPAAASSYVSAAVSGFNGALKASDECSTAADARLPRDLAAAASDFSKARNNLNKAWNGISAWSGNK